MGWFYLIKAVLSAVAVPNKMMLLLLLPWWANMDSNSWQKKHTHVGKGKIQLTDDSVRV